MAISTEQAVSIEFRYDTPDSGDQIWVRYHTTDIGPTISLSDNRDQWFDFPASLFSETTDFLRANYGLMAVDGVIPATAPAKKPMPFGQQRPSLPNSNSLAPPEIEAEAVDETVEEVDQPKPVVLADVNPIQSLQALASGQFQPGVAQQAPDVVPASGYKGQGIVIDTRQEVAAMEKQSGGFGRAVIRTNHDAIARMSDEELLHKDRLNHTPNDLKGITRKG